MSDYRRYRVPGATVFVTLVTYRRRPILTTQDGRRILRESIQAVKHARPMEFVATVLLPDHWHALIELPPGDADYSTRLKRIKEEFTKSWLGLGLPETPVTASQRRRGERGVWLPRFWEETIEDEEDIESFVDYIHYNPAKHGLAERVRDWPWSSFHRFVRLGHYPPDWGGVAPQSAGLKKEWGEP